MSTRPHPRRRSIRPPAPWAAPLQLPPVLPHVVVRVTSGGFHPTSSVCADYVFYRCPTSVAYVPRLSCSNEQSAITPTLPPHAHAPPSHARPPLTPTSLPHAHAPPSLPRPPRDARPRQDYNPSLWHVRTQRCGPAGGGHGRRRRRRRLRPASPPVVAPFLDGGCWGWWWWWGVGRRGVDGGCREWWWWCRAVVT